MDDFFQSTTHKSRYFHSFLLHIPSPDLLIKKPPLVHLVELPTKSKFGQHRWPLHQVHATVKRATEGELLEPGWPLATVDVLAKCLSKRDLLQRLRPLDTCDGFVEAVPEIETDKTNREDNIVDGLIEVSSEGKLLEALGPVHLIYGLWSISTRFIWTAEKAHNAAV